MATVKKTPLDLSPYQIRKGLKVTQVVTEFASGRQSCCIEYDAGNFIFSVHEQPGEFSVCVHSTEVICVSTFEAADYIATKLAEHQSYPCPDTNNTFNFGTVKERAVVLSAFAAHPEAEEA
ncbi:hypothetical protein [Reinekea sp. G2M2-21]|uniref:hypothetical protein n=1 Tax=Reinekea sp. G2M2-21 TaxID=2788942 RepID=UPI0018AB4D90|nr:hypothetical protein [Reinekea sp. G2M2-21]